MKFATIASICLAATAAPRFAKGSEFDMIMSLVEQLQEEATALSTKYGGMDAEVTSLLEQLGRCEGGGAGTTSDAPPTTAASDDDYDDDYVEGEGEEGEGDEEMDKATTAPVPDPISMDDDPEDDDDDDRSNNEPETDAPVTMPPSSSGGGGGGDQDRDDGGDSSRGGVFKFTKGQSWNYNLATPVKTDLNVDVFFIDMDGAQGTIDTLHSLGKGVVCYISIGTVEDWRDDAKQFPSSAIGGGVDGWAGEKWLDVNNMQVREIMSARVKKAEEMECDAVEPDNMMVYSEGGVGVKVSEAEQIEYNRWFAKEVHAHGMAVGLKNAVELVPTLVGDFDFALNEECHEWDECHEYESTFLAQGKPVFNVEYNLGMSVCDSSNKMGLDTIVKDYDLDAALCSCVDSSRDYDCKNRR